MTCVGLKRFLMLLAPLALVVANPAAAVVIPAYFGWNYVVDSLGAGAPPGRLTVKLEMPMVGNGTGASR